MDIYLLVVKASGENVFDGQLSCWSHVFVDSNVMVSLVHETTINTVCV